MRGVPSRRSLGCRLVRDYVRGCGRGRDRGHGHSTGGYGNDCGRDVDDGRVLPARQSSLRSRNLPSGSGDNRTRSHLHTRSLRPTRNSIRPNAPQNVLMPDTRRDDCDISYWPRCAL